MIDLSGSTVPIVFTSTAFRGLLRPSFATPPTLNGLTRKLAGVGGTEIPPTFEVPAVHYAATISLAAAKAFEPRFRPATTERKRFSSEDFMVAT